MKIITVIILSLCVFLSSCGLILKPEAKSKEATAQIDVPILLLDSSGLLFLTLPGIAPGFVAIVSASLGAIISGGSLLVDYYYNTLFITKLQFSTESTSSGN